MGTTVLSAVAAITASWFAAKMAIDYDANKESGKTSLQIVEAFIDLQGCASRYVRNSKEWKFKLEVEKLPRRSLREEKDICSVGALKKALVGSDGILPSKQHVFVKKLCAELKEEIEQISVVQLKSVLPERDSLNSAKEITEAFRTSQWIFANAEFGFALFSDAVKLSGYQCENGKLAISEDSEAIESRYKHLTTREFATDPPVGGTSNIHVGSLFGLRTDPFTGRAVLHSGMDFVAPPGTPVFAVVSGRVESGYHPEYGNFVAIATKNGREEVWYNHLSSVTVINGATVNVGDQVGALGSTGRATGPHLHFEKRINDIPVDPSGYQLKDIFKLRGTRK